ncbi:MAG: DUF427 domain-containing protein [Pseudomonadota bacterium]
MPELSIENVQSYPRPPMLRPAGAPIRVVFAGQVAAETEAALAVLETHHAPTYYIPRADFSAELIAADGRSFCEWKGVARYWSLRMGDQTAPRAAWDYPRPSSAFAALVDHIAVYVADMDACFVGSLKAEPQAGGFYGGWVTSNLRGTVKGSPGTEHW